MDTVLAEILVNAGAFGVVLALLIYIWKRDKMHNEQEKRYNTTLNNHLEHETEAKLELAKAITKLADKVDNCPHNK